MNRETTNNALNKNKLNASEAAKQMVLSRNPNTAIQEMMETIDALRSVYLEENEALESADTKRFLSLQQRKLGIARTYQDGARQLVERKDEMKTADPDLKKKLEDMQADFSEITSKNLSALERVRGSVQRMNDRIMTSARDAAQKRNVQYRSNGSLEQNERSVSIGVTESA